MINHYNWLAISICYAFTYSIYCQDIAVSHVAVVFMLFSSHNNYYTATIIHIIKATHLCAEIAQLLCNILKQHM